MMAFRTGDVLENRVNLPVADVWDMGAISFGAVDGAESFNAIIRVGAISRGRVSRSMSREIYDDVIPVLDFSIVHQTNEGLDDIDACRNVVVV